MKVKGVKAAIIYHIWLVHCKVFTKTITIVSKCFVTNKQFNGFSCLAVSDKETFSKNCLLKDI